MSCPRRWSGREATLIFLYFVFLPCLKWTPVRPRDQPMFSEAVAQLTLAFSVGAFSDLLSVERRNPNLALVKSQLGEVLLNCGVSLRW